MSAAILEVHRSIRRALQRPLYNSALALGSVVPAVSPPLPAILWTGVEFEWRGLETFMSAEVAFSDVIVREMGTNPMVEGRGHVSMNIRTRLDGGEDANDALLPIIVAAYPYGAPVSFGGIDVHVDKARHEGYGKDGPWLTGLVSVSWNTYRRS